MGCVWTGYQHALHVLAHQKCSEQLLKSSTFHLRFLAAKTSIHFFNHTFLSGVFSLQLFQPHVFLTFKPFPIFAPLISTAGTALSDVMAGEKSSITADGLLFYSCALKYLPCNLKRQNTADKGWPDATLMFLCQIRMETMCFLKLHIHH